MRENEKREESNTEKRNRQNAFTFRMIGNRINFTSSTVSRSSSSFSPPASFPSAAIAIEISTFRTENTFAKSNDVGAAAGKNIIVTFIKIERARVCVCVQERERTRERGEEENKRERRRKNERERRRRERKRKQRKRIKRTE